MLRNVRRYCRYKGYGRTFRFNGAFEEQDRINEGDRHILAIDAVINWHNKQYGKEQILRDLNKAYAGFSMATGDDSWISTGMWGCGAFNGDPVLKFLQQM